MELVFWGVGEGGGGVGTPSENMQMGSSDGCSPNRRQAEVPLTIAAARSPPKCALRKEIMGDGMGERGSLGSLT